MTRRLGWMAVAVIAGCAGCVEGTDDVLPDLPREADDVLPDLPRKADDAVPDLPPDGDDVQPEVADVQPDGDDVQPDVLPEIVDVLPDGDDTAPDCGPTLCIDCRCQCRNGMWHTYGGCFDGCDTIPPEVRDCSADCTDVCGDDVTGKPCTGPDECGEGYLCLEHPCPKCGVPPQSVCVPEPCPIDGCWLPGHCGENERCVGASIIGGELGQCLANVEPPYCWESADCPAGAYCDEAIHCPKCVACAMMTHPGTCRAVEGQEAVVLWVEESIYFPGEQVAPWWYNLADEVAYLNGCETFSIERRDEDTGEWVDKGPPAVCGWEGIARKLGPGDALAAFAFAAPAEGLAGGFGSYRLRGTYRTGCLDDKPLSQSECKGGPFDVLSPEYMVGYPM
ncbi:MAG: hypothetical protein FJ087_10345 [Deltaproteobacteria bacterium]|nr:hypothetical protein [Deltaproteobacteria bacterium]